MTFKNLQPRIPNHVIVTFHDGGEETIDIGNWVNSRFATLSEFLTGHFDPAGLRWPDGLMLDNSFIKEMLAKIAHP